MTLRASDTLLPNQRNGEQVVFLLRRHWFRFSGNIIIFLVGLLIPLVVGLVIPGLTAEVVERTLVGIIAIMVASLIYLFSALAFLHAWVDFYLDTWIVTNQRIVAIEQRRLFSRVVAELQLENIQDVTVEVNGVVETMFRFGDIDIQTAGETPRFHFDDVPDPYGVARKIMELHEQCSIDKETKV